MDGPRESDVALPMSRGSTNILCATCTNLNDKFSKSIEAACMAFYDDIKAPGDAFKFYVNGEWKESSSGKTQAILNPSDNLPAYQVQGET